MAELATGAVSSLLGVIRNEAQLLGGVRGDVQFIKEEMESMSSFLLHLARTAPPSGEHDEQVRTWMNQVRLLAQDCNNCIDLYLYRGNPEIHLPKGGPLRYLWWTPWFLRKLLAQHRAAFRLRELRDRARDVGERRLRYGVEVPAKVAAAAAAVEGAGGGDDEHDGDHQLVVAIRTTGRSGRRATFEPPTLDDYFEKKLDGWIQGQASTGTSVSSVAIVAPNEEYISAAAQEASAVANSCFIQVQAAEIFVDIPAVHLDYWRQVKVKHILCYILQELRIKAGVDTSPHQEQEEGMGEEDPRWAKKFDFYNERKRLVRDVEENIKTMKIEEKLEKIKRELKEVKVEQRKQLKRTLKNTKKRDLQCKISEEPLSVLLIWLHYQAVKNTSPILETSHNAVIEEAAKKLQNLIETKEETTKEEIGEEDIEEDEEDDDDNDDDDDDDDEEDNKKQQKAPICLYSAQYINILREGFPNTSNSMKHLQAHLEQGTKQKGTETSTSTNATMAEDQIKAMIHKVVAERLQDLHGDKSNKKRETSKQGDQDTISDAVVIEAIKKIKNIMWKIKEQLRIKGIVDMIKGLLLKTKMFLIILKVDDGMMAGSRWEETRNALSLLDCDVRALILSTTTSTLNAEGYCYPRQEPIQYSFVGLYYDILLMFTSKHKNEDSYDPQIFRAILDQCEPHEFCIKMFAHAMYVNPKRSSEELNKLQTALRAVSPKSFASIAKKVFKFSYNDLPKEFKSCLLYLAIFPPGHKISRSTLIGRWVVEGLITTEDWRWSSSVNKANHCFDTLIEQWLIYPADISATGEVKSCIVGHLVHGFITKIAGKQRMMETRLSHHLARHFSISNDLRLRGSDKINNFLHNLSQPSKFSLLKVLDLEGCRCFGVNSKRYLKNICCKIKLLKYLSLKGTDITQLHSEINNLHELEVLDIRKTHVPVNATRNVRLLKLKRLLAGHTDPSKINTDTSTAIKVMESPTRSVEIPEKVENMEGMEVLSNVKPHNHQDLKDIGMLWQLRKLGVVIEDRKKHLKSLLEAISNLSDCLRSLSITIIPKAGRHKAVPPNGPSIDTGILKYPPKVLESLSITGTTKKVHLLRLLLSHSDNNQLTKVTLSETSFSQNDLDVLAMLPKLQCVRLRYKAYKESKLTFKKDQFKFLKYLLFEEFDMTDIIFEAGATGALEKIVLPLSQGTNLLGVNNLSRLVELELNNNKRNNSISSDDKGKGINSSSSTTTCSPSNNSVASATTEAATTPAATTNTTGASATMNTAINSAADAAIAANSRKNDITTPATTNTAAIVTTDKTITAATNTNMFISLLKNVGRIAKVTLRNTMLKKDDLQILAKNPTIRCLVLLDKAYEKSQISFDKNDFGKLNLLVVDGDITDISFAAGSCPKLEKFVWTVTQIKSLSGINNLPRLKELEFKCDFVPYEVQEAINVLKDRLYFTRYQSEN